MGRSRTAAQMLFCANENEISGGPGAVRVAEIPICVSSVIKSADALRGNLGFFDRAWEGNFGRFRGRESV